MNKCKGFSKMWFLVLLLVVVVAGCGGSDGGGGDVADTTAPAVSFTAPADATTNVALNANVTATFSEAMDVATTPLQRSP